MLDMHGRPSELLGIEDTYLAFCFDEACAFIIKNIQDGREPIKKDGMDKNGNSYKYSKPSDVYKKFN